MINRLPEHWTTIEQRDRRLTGTERRHVVSPHRSAGWKAEIEGAIGKHPLATVLAGLALGVLLGWFVKR